MYSKLEHQSCSLSVQFVFQWIMFWKKKSRFCRKCRNSGFFLRGRLVCVTCNHGNGTRSKYWDIEWLLYSFTCIYCEEKNSATPGCVSSTFLHFHKADTLFAALHPSIKVTPTDHSKHTDRASFFFFLYENAAVVLQGDLGVAPRRIGRAHATKCIQPAGTEIIGEAVKQQENGFCLWPPCQEGSQLRLSHKHVQACRGHYGKHARG